jgi:hypothetical protein
LTALPSGKARRRRGPLLPRVDAAGRQHRALRDRMRQDYA